MLLGCTRCHIAKVIGKAKSHDMYQVAKVDAILTDSHLDTIINRIKICILMNVIVPKLDIYAGELWRGNAKLVKHLETVQMTAAAKKVLRRMLKFDEKYSIKSRTWKINVPT